MPILPKLLHKIEEEGALLNSFYEGGQNYPDTKPYKDTTKKENDRLISLMVKDANTLNKILAKLIQQH